MSRDYLSDILNEAYISAIAQWQEEGISEEEINERISDERVGNAAQAMLNQASSDIHNYFVDKKFEIAHHQKIQADKFFAHHNEIWGECFAVSEAMYVMSVEAAEEYSRFVNEDISDEERVPKQYTYLTLQYMHGRCCQEYLEILYLMKLGFADCAYARWRSMYELCCNASFILKHGEVIAKQYFEQAQTNEHKYTWTKGIKRDDGSELRITTFQGIQDNCNVDEAWKEQYRLACFVNHGSPQGTFRRLCLKDDTSLVVVGQSDFGITTPAEHSAISLSWMSSMFLSIFPNMDAVAHAKVIFEWVEEVRKAYFKVADECFGVGFNYKGENQNDND